MLSPMRMRAAVLLSAMLGVMASAQGTAPFNDSIRVSDLRADVSFLAGDGFQGRYIGTAENLLAADFGRRRSVR